THSTALGAKKYQISGDVHGIAEQFLEHYIGGDLVAPGFAGASGNIDPWVRVLPDFRTNNGWIPEPVLMGTMLGEEVARVLETSPTVVTNYELNTLIKTVELPGKQANNADPSAGLKSSFQITLGRLGEVAFVGWGA